MKNLNPLIVAFCVMLGLASCKQESVEADKANDKPVVEADVSTQKYVYKGSTYTISLRKEGDSYQLLKGKDNQKVHSLLEKQNVAQLVDLRDKNTIYVFDSHEESQLFVKSISSSKSGRTKELNLSSGFYPVVGVHLYTETQYGGVSHLHYNPWDIAYYPQRDYRYFVTAGENQRIDLNDQVGSIYFDNPELYSITLTCWEDINEVGRGISFYNSRIPESGVFDLGQYRFGGLWGNKYSWNDRISSSRLYLN